MSLPGRFLACMCVHFTDKKETTQGIFCHYKMIDSIPEIFASTNALGIEQLRIINSCSERKVTDKFVIPKDILANHWVTYSIRFGPCYECKERQLLQVDPEAFWSSRNSVKELAFAAFDMLGLNYSFLDNFNHLEILAIHNCSNVHFLEFPFLPNLRQLLIYNDCRGLNDWAFLQPISNGLEIFYLKNNLMRDGDINRLLECWLLKGQTKYTLTTLILEQNSLTHIPEQLKYFSKLQKIWISHQNEPGFKALSTPIIFSDNTIAYNFIDLSSNHISHIEPGFFQGLI